MNPIKIKKVLIANRGGIVSRINFTCQVLGIKTVAIFGPQDDASPYIFKTDEAYRIDKDGYAAYLDQDEIIKIALKAKVDAIHPGYGFLSEDYNFAQKVVDAGFVWIGPCAETIKLMGDKNEARRCAQRACVPTIPGANLSVRIELQQALQVASLVGFPLILKDPLGGGGKAARRVDTPEELGKALKLTISEAQRLTGTTTILMERYLVNPRHVEIQVAGDGQNFIHLFERDCSIQRRYQKIVEEAPCSFVNKQTLEKMYEASIRLVQSVKYKNIGTLEFLVTSQEEFFFLEMNTRLQVEHSVTEAITGIDLVAMQIFIAENGKLPLNQSEISQRGHAIECRIYSENPAQNFMPCVGAIQNFQIPNAPNVRMDHDLEDGKEITPFFDPMLAQLTVYGQSRDVAIANMLQALKELAINGITTNINFLASLINADKFKLGNFDTQFLTKEMIDKICIASTVQGNMRQIDQELGAVIAAVMQKLHEPTQSSSTNNQVCAVNNWKAQLWR
jgi:acetyl/propionyl-CoA carboxylase alpha subunit